MGRCLKEGGGWCNKCVSELGRKDTINYYWFGGVGVRWGRGKVTGIEGCACTVRVRVRKILVSIINDDSDPPIQIASGFKQQ